MFCVNCVAKQNENIFDYSSHTLIIISYAFAHMEVIR